MNITVAPAHRSFDRSQIGPDGVEQRLIESETTGLVANQRREDVTFPQG